MSVGSQSSAPALPDPVVDDSRLLATLLHLGRRAREAASAAELDFVAVNETHALVPYRQAALWLNGFRPATGQVVALSGVAGMESNAPYVIWLSSLFRSVPPTEHLPVRLVDSRELSVELAHEWSEWLPAHALQILLPPQGAFKGGILLLAREQDWTENAFRLLQEWGALLAQAYAIRAPNSMSSQFRRWYAQWATEESNSAGQGLLAIARRWFARRSLWQISLMLMMLVALLPVRMTVLAPAELVPLRPAVIRAPMDGVIDKLQVLPNQGVKKGDALFEFDRVSLDSRLQIAIGALATSQAEYRNRAQRALFDPDSKAQLAVIQGQIEEKRAEVEYLKSLNGRATVMAPQDGVALFGDATEWIGRPVVTGERVMVLADPNAAEVEAWLSPGDAVPLEIGSSVMVYLNADPLSPLQARLRYVAHEPILRPDGHYAHRVRAELLSGEKGRVGLKGTAKLSGGQVLLGYWVMRRPLAQARAWLGW
jgi:hypothetical protein